MADPDQSDQSHLFDETTIPIVDIASSVASNEEIPVVENVNEETVTTTTESPMIVRPAVPESEVEVINLASDNESEENGVISGIF